MTTQQQNRVQSMKIKFENLISLEPYDVSIPNANTELQKRSKYKFQRSSTNFNLLNNDSSVELIQHKLKLKKTVLTDSHIEEDIKSNRIKNSFSFNQGTDKEKENDLELRYSVSPENTPVKLIRQTSDPLRRGSVKRSPAFREPNNKALISKLSPLPNDTKTSLIDRQLTESQIDPSVFLTDTLKKALKQPLPDGPPPRKPPRTFESPIREVIELDINEGNENVAIHLKSNNNDELNNKKNIKTFFNNFPCSPSSPIYDTVITEEEDLTKDNITNSNINTNTASAKSLASSESEHIYMEPFSHLKLKQSIKKSKNLDASVNVLDKNESLITSQCVCPERHNNNDSHYMCSLVSDNYPTSEDNNKEIRDDSSSSGESINANTYDQINLLVNAAFDDKTLKLDDDSAIAIEDIPKNQSTLYDHNTMYDEQKITKKISRSLTEKRKNYIRRISNTNLIPTTSYGSLQQSFKSPILQTFTVAALINNVKVEPTSERINKYNKLINANNNNNTTNIAKTEDSFATAEKSNSKYNKLEYKNHNDAQLFEMCLLIGYNMNTNNAYIKMIFPENVKVPENIEQLVFPNENLYKQQSLQNQDYSLVLTDNSGGRIYGYCRRIIPESSEVCLPLSYCLLTKVNASGFYFKLLKEIEIRHGQTDLQRISLLNNVQMLQIPSAGKYLHIKLPNNIRPKTNIMNNVSNNTTSNARRLSLEANPKWLTETAEKQMHNSLKKLEILASDKNSKTTIKENGNNDATPFDFSLINRSLFKDTNTQDEILIKRPNDLRLESTELNDLYQNTGIELLLNIFSTILLERKVILLSQNITLLTSCVMGLESIIYPLQWPFTLITMLPHNLTEICYAPFPVLVGTIESLENILIDDIEDGILVDLDKRIMLKKCGDESTILPENLRKSLTISLEMIGLLKEGKMLSSVMISEAFLRFFIELFANLDFNQFDKQMFINSHSCQSMRQFLEWFLETSMFQNLIKFKGNNDSIDKHFYALFNTKLMENKNKTNQNMETIIKNCKIINKKAKKFKDRFKELF